MVSAVVVVVVVVVVIFIAAEAPLVAKSVKNQMLDERVER